MASFDPQNLAQRAQRLGKDLEQRSNQFIADIRNSSNINVNGIINSVEGTAQELVGATSNPKIPRISQTNDAAFTTTIPVDNAPPWTNELERFASFNYIFTLACLDDEEINDPDSTYRIKQPKNIILRSGGTGQNKVKTIYEKNGAVEYYIDDIEISSIIVPNPKTKQTNATSLRFTVSEPYSMGMFLQTLQIAAVTAGHKNYIDAPYLLTVEFKGYDDNGNIVPAPNTRRLFPLKFTNVTFNVSEGGSQYAVEAIPWHESAFSDQVQTVKTDIQLSGRNLHEVLQSGGASLASVLNERLLKNQEAGQISTADQYVIVFPNDDNSAEERILGIAENNSGATSASGAQRQLDQDTQQLIYETITGIENGKIPADFDSKLSELYGVVIRRSEIGENIRSFAEDTENVNKIGKSKIVKSYLDGGKVPFGEAKFTEVEDKPGVFQRGKLQISDEGRTLTFAAGMKVQDIIEELILISDYGRQIANVEPDEFNMVPWFKIETQVYNVSDNDAVQQIGRKPKVYVYRVVPYMVSASRFSNPSKPSPKVKNVKAQAAKEYNYIYTGQNKDILSFDIQIDAAFFVALNPMRGQASSDSKQGTKNELSSGNKDPVTKTGEGDTEATSSAGQKRVEERYNQQSGNQSSPGKEHVETQVARDVNDAIVNSPTDLVMVEMEIMGDPYYIADSGMGNYNAAKDPQFINITKDGSMDYQTSEVDVIINFRTPLDYQGDGYMEFPGGGSAPVGAFTGLYQVTFVDHKFSGGQFTQVLKMIRRPLQDSETTVKPTTTDNKFVKEGTKENKIDDGWGE